MLLFAAIFFLLPTLKQLRENGKSAVLKDTILLAELEAELATIPAPEDSFVRQHTSLMQQGRGHVNQAYKTGLHFEAIKAHYNVELRKRGWIFVEEENVIYDGHDYGGKQVFYCKVPLVVNVQYAGGQEQEFGWTYSIAVSRRLYNCDQKDWQSF